MRFDKTITTSGILRANLHVVDVQVVVGVVLGRLAVEGEAYLKAFISIFSQVDAHLFASGGVSDVVVDIFRIRVVPLAQDIPSLTVVDGSQHDESVICAIGFRSGNSTAPSGQSQVKSKGFTRLNNMTWGDEPTLTSCTPNLKISMVVKDTVISSKMPIWGRAST